MLNCLVRVIFLLGWGKLPDKDKIFYSVMPVLFVRLIYCSDYFLYFSIRYSNGVSSSSTIMEWIYYLNISDCFFDRQNTRVYIILKIGLSYMRLMRISLRCSYEEIISII